MQSRVYEETMTTYKCPKCESTNLTARLDGRLNINTGVYEPETPTAVADVTAWRHVDCLDCDESFEGHELETAPSTKEPKQACPECGSTDIEADCFVNVNTHEISWESSERIRCACVDWEPRFSWNDLVDVNPSETTK